MLVIKVRMASNIINFIEKNHVKASTSSVSSNDILKKKLAAISVENDENQLEKQCKLYKTQLDLTMKKLKQAQLALKKAASANLEKDITIQTLKEKLAGFEKKKIKNTVPHSDCLSDAEMKDVRSVKSGAKNDSTFVFKLVQSLYKNDLSKLNSKSVTGKGRNTTKKDRITPLKKDIIEKLLMERAMNDGGQDVTERLQKTNMHIKNAIHNILRRNNPLIPNQSSQTPLPVNVPSAFPHSSNIQQYQNYAGPSFNQTFPDARPTVYQNHSYSSHIQQSQNDAGPSFNQTTFPDAGLSPFQNHSYLPHVQRPQNNSVSLAYHSQITHGNMNGQ